MSAYVYITSDQLVTDKPCVLYSILLVNDGLNEGHVDIYDGAGAEAGYMVARCYVGAKTAHKYNWKGLELSRGLYIDVDDKTDKVTVEWDPVGYPKQQAV